MSYRPFKVTITRVVMLVGALLAAAALSISAYNSALAAPGDATEPFETKYDENRTDQVATFGAMDPEGGIVYWSLGGADAGQFSIIGGVLSFKTPPNFEDPMDAPSTTPQDDQDNNNYQVTVQASDGGGDDPTMFYVSVMVKNVEEAGRVVLSSLQPQAGIQLTADLSDPDGIPNNPDNASDPVPWKWSKSDTQGGEFTDISGATGDGLQATYMPDDGDVGNYLRVTFTYVDPEDDNSEKNANGISARPVWQARSDMQPPAFPGTALARSVAENSAPGTPVGVPVAATDPTTNDVLTYTMTTNGASSFNIDADTGQIRVGAKTRLNREATDTYTVTVTATDTSGVTNVVTGPNAVEATEVTITITDVDEAPSVKGLDAVTDPTTRFSPMEGSKDLTPNNETTDQYTGDDPEDDSTTLSLSGPDASDFTISNGVLAFKDDPDYEDPKGGANGNSNLYEVTIEASDGDNVGMLNVTVKVMNMGEAGKVTLSAPKPEIGMPLTATLEDDDGGVMGVTWQWASAIATDDGTGCPEPEADVPNATWTDISGAKSAMYSPSDDDPDVTGRCLQASATYIDYSDLNPADKPVARKVSDNPVRTDSDNRAPTFGQSTYQLYVAEGSYGDATMVGDRVTAKDANDDVLTYTLSGADAGPFMITQDTADNDSSSNNDGGQIQVDGAQQASEVLDREKKGTYRFTVTATDPSGASSSTTVTINITDMNEPPKLTGDDQERFAENGAGPVATIMGADPEGDRVFWSLSGTDADDFVIDGGVLNFKNPPDFEASTANGGVDDNVYEVTVGASDADGASSDLPIMITVTDEEEQGRVTFSSLQPQDGTLLTSTLIDPDNAVPTDVSWKWASSTSARSGFGDISGATGAGLSATYMPATGEVGRFLRVTFTYTDGTDEPDTAEAVTASAVRVDRADDDPPAFLSATLARSVAENSAPGTPVGVPVAATDPTTNDVLTYTMTTNGASSFNIDADTGQIRVGAKTRLNREATATYTVTVTATDTSGPTSTDSTEVTITITDVDEAPSVKGLAAVTDPTTRFSPMEGSKDLTPNNETTDQYTGDDPEDDSTTLSLSGPDASDFTISNGVLAFKDDPDYEDPKGGANGNSNLYEVTIEASDGDNVGMLNVTVKVMNMREAGKVTLSAPKPEIGMPLTATLEDDDGGVMGVTWQWASAATDGNDDCPVAGDPEDPLWGNISGEKSATYTPTDEDPNVTGQCLQASATYIDAYDLNPAEKPVARKVSDNPVRTDSTNQAPAFRESTYQLYVVEDTYTDGGTDVGDPVAAKDANNDILTYTLSGADAGPFKIANDTGSGQISVDGAQSPGQVKLDREKKDTYTFTVTAMDPSGLTSSATVTINVTDVDEMPTVELITSVLAVSGTDSVVYPENDMGEVATYSATGSQAGGATWSLEGTNAAAFMIDANGMLSFRASPDYENPMVMDNVYMVTVVATSATNRMQKGKMEITVSVSNVEETGMVTLSDMSPLVDGEVMADLTDPDMVVDSSVRWQWSRSMDMTTWMEIMGADMAAYTVTSDDDGYYLQATATYTDGYGADSATAMTANAVSTVADQAGTVTLSPTAPQVGDEVMASLTDLDGMVSAEMWQWSRSMDMADGWTDIMGANSATYTVMEMDDGYYLRATVSYTDGHGAGKDAMMVTASAVVASLADRYDADGSGTIDKAEVITAINDYLFPEGDETITKAQVIDLINLYLFPDG